MKTRLPAFVWLHWSFPRCWPFPAVQIRPLPVWGTFAFLYPRSNPRLISRIKHMVRSIIFCQGNTFSHLYTTVKDLAPPAVIRELSDANTITINWEECGTQQGPKAKPKWKILKAGFHHPCCLLKIEKWYHLERAGGVYIFDAISGYWVAWRAL